MSTRKLPSQRTGKAGTTRDFGLVPREAIPVRPSCPGKLGGRAPLASTVDAWDRLWRSPVVQVVDLESDLEAVVRWASLLDERERAMRVFRRQRIVEGSKGQPALNPVWDVVRSCDHELRALEDRIGLTPKARLLLGITLAEAGKSLDQLNRMLDDDDQDEPEAVDPRLATIDVAS